MSFVYFISDGRDAIKIGYSEDPGRRLTGLGVGSSNALSLIGFVEGSRAQEKHLHESLAAHSLRGEWFNDCAEVRAAIESALRDGLPPAEAIPSPFDLLDESSKEAVRFVEIIQSWTAEDSPLREGPVKKALWRLSYRPSNVKMGEYMSLLDAARASIDEGLARLSADAAYVDGIISRLRQDRDRLAAVEARIRVLRAEIERLSGSPVTDWKD